MEGDLEKRFAKAFTSAMHSLHCLAGKIMKSSAIPLAQYRLLMLLREKGALTVGEISTFLGIAQSTASELCSRALESGRLQRQIDQNDARKVVFSLSDSARKLLRARRRQMEKIYHTVLDNLSPEQQQQLVTAFETIAQLLDVKTIQRG
ncbi:MAG: MarR family winged helix-turn-helix transcriptional regulator [candidate division KSB1 bacterium]|nr:MarR family winged helix-turn-helix transcriptional regulator [candidate division KSB1 bacterium]